jgi:hypothetical protein
MILCGMIGYFWLQNARLEPSSSSPAAAVLARLRSDQSRSTARKARRSRHLRTLSIHKSVCRRKKLLPCR